MLTELKVKKLKAKEKEYKVSDDNGLYLLVTPAGGKLWRYDYRFGYKDDGKTKKRKTLSIGKYPDISLSSAREKLLNARTLLANGIDPGAEKKKQKHDPGSTVSALAKDWFDAKKAHWGKKHTDRMETLLNRDISMIGDIQIQQLSALEIENALNATALRSVEMSRRFAQFLRGVYSTAIRRGIVNSSPMPAMKDVLKPVKYKHRAAVTDPYKLAEVLKKTDYYHGHYVTRCAFKLAPRLFVRPIELRSMEWSEINFRRKRWEIPDQKMKMGDALIVPLASQCLEILKEMHQVTGHAKYVFPNFRDNNKPMSENTINKGLRILGFEKNYLCGHGFRATARTIIHEELKFDPDVIEAQLAHQVPDRHGRAYNRTLHLDDRVRMMQEWADYLDRIKNGG